MSDTSRYRIDPHVKVLDRGVVERAKAGGLDAIVYAPHFTQLPTIERRAKRYTDEDLLVVPARELFTGSWRSRKHVLAVGLSDPIPDFIGLEGAMDELERQDAAVLAPHPAFLTVSLDRRDIERYAHVIDAVEVYNPKHRWWHNRRAAAIRSATGHSPFASSYAHLSPTVGAAWVEFEGALESVDSVVDAFRQGLPRSVGRRSGLAHAYRCSMEFAHLAWENSWPKFDRVVRSGREPTHPSQEVYEDRFRDMSVY